MILLPLGLMFIGYQLGWYGYATIQQPVSGGCIGFVDLLWPGHVSKVDQCIQNNWGKSGGGGSGSSTNSGTSSNAPVKAVYPKAS